jgi:glyoxylase-like metal-dependent hydrolase (beta-lactamase superfamily II)
MKLTDRIYLVGSGGQGFNLTDDYDCHIYLLDGGDELALIDAGAGMGVPQIVEIIRSHGFEPEQVGHLLITHAHGDHAGGTARLAAALGGPQIYMHEDCAQFLIEGDEKAISLAPAKRVGLYPEDYHFEPHPVDVILKDGDRIAVGDLELHTVSTPGHSIGHVSFLLDHDGRTEFFGGDLVFFGGQILLQNAWDCELQDHLRSLVNLRDAGIDGFFPGHRSFCLKDGQRHIDAAVSIVDGLLVPPNFTYSWQ